MRVLCLDIENMSTKGYFWSLWGINIPIEMIEEGQKVLCWAAKWIDKKGNLFRRIDDKDFLTYLWELLDKADAVLTFNGRKHDIPHINKEFLKAGLGPPSPYKHIDLLETAKKQFKFESNKLQFLVQELGLGSKMRHEGFDLWLKCAAGDEDAWKIMQKYNIHDVRLTEKLYKKIRPWITNHPNRSLLAGETICPYCGSKHLHSRGTGVYRTQTGMFRKFHCQSCGGWSRTRYTELDVNVRKKIIVPAQ
jgi:hypothetical protein